MPSMGNSGGGETLAETTALGASTTDTLSLASVNFSGSITGDGTGIITNPGSGLRSELFGVSAADNGADDCVIIGNGATVAAATDDFSTVIGSGAVGSGGAGAFAIGYSADSTAIASMAIGFRAASAYEDSIAIGYDAATTKANQLVIGSDNREIEEIVFGNGVSSTSAGNGAVLITTTNTSGTNILAYGLRLQSGLGTGTGAASEITFRTPNVGTTGTTLQTAVTRLTLNETGALFAGTPLLTEGTSTTTPGTATVAFYAKADGLIYSKDDAGAETLMSGGAAGDAGSTILATYNGSATGAQTITVSAGLTTGDSLEVSWWGLGANTAFKTEVNGGDLGGGSTLSTNVKAGGKIYIHKIDASNISFFGSAVAGTTVVWANALSNALANDTSFTIVIGGTSATTYGITVEKVPA